MPLTRKSQPSAIRVHSSGSLRPLRVGSSGSPATRRAAWADSSVQVRPQSRGGSHTASVLAPCHGASFANLIRVKSTKPKQDLIIAKHESQGEYELDRRLKWIRNIFSEEHGGVKQSVDLDPALGSMPRPKSQPTRDQLPQWVFMPSTKGRCGPAGPTPVTLADIADDLAGCLGEGGSIRRSESHLSGMGQPGYRSSHKHRKSSNPNKCQSFDGQRQGKTGSAPKSPRHQPSGHLGFSDVPKRRDSTDEWCQRVLSQGVKRSAKTDSGTDEILEKHDGDVDSNTWTKHFGADRMLSPAQETVTEVRKAFTEHSVVTVPENLNLKSENQVMEVLRVMCGYRMEAYTETLELCNIWKRLGYPYSVNTSWLEELIEEHTTGSFMEAEEFMKIWEGYFFKMDLCHVQAFKEAAQESFVVSILDLPLVFRKLGFWPMPGALQEACRRIVPSHREHEITVQDFHRIYNDLYSRAGLTVDEHRRALTLFKKHSGGTTTLKADLFHVALREMRPHFLLTQHEPTILSEAFIHFLLKVLVTKVSEARVSLDANDWKNVLDVNVEVRSDHATIECNILESDFLVACNVLHQRVARRVARAAECLGLSPSEHWSLSEVLQLFDELGQVSSSLSTILQEIESGTDVFSFSDVYAMLLVFCDWEGFAAAQRQELSWLFNLFVTALPDVEKKGGKLRVCELKRALRWMCYTPSQHRLSTFLDLSNLSSTDYVNFEEFIHIVANYRYINMGLARNEFRGTRESRGHTHSTWRLVSCRDLSRLMLLVGHDCSKEEVELLTEVAESHEGKIHWREFLRLEQVYRKNIQETLKENMGFTVVEAAALQRDFMEHVAPKKDSILYDGFAKILKKHLPRMPIDAKVRKLVQESDTNNNHEIEFRELLWLMRRLIDKDSRSELDRFKTLIDELGYSHDEVHQLRDLFNVSDVHLVGYLGIAELTTLFGGLIPLDQDSETDLHIYMDEVDDNHDGVLDFGEFLHLMKVLERHNWKNILGAAAKQVRREEEVMEIPAKQARPLLSRTKSGWHEHTVVL